MAYEDNELIGLLTQLVRTQSTNPGVYESGMTEFVYSWLERETAGCGVELYKDEALPGRSNVVACLRGEQDDSRMVMISHQDTVPVGNGWTKDPFAAEIEGTKMYGRGSGDMKGGFAAAMYAFRNAAKSGKKPKRTLVFIASVDEEDEMHGSMHAVESGWIRRDDWVLDTEPTGGYVIGSHKGKIWFEITTKGKPAHGSAPGMGVDAIVAMSHVVLEINKGIKACAGQSELGPSTVCFGTIKGGVNLNIVADTCTIEIDVRLTPPLTPEGAIKIVEDAIAVAAQQVPGASGEYKIISSKPAVVLKKDSELLSNVLDCAEKVTGTRPAVYPMPAYTDSAIAAALAGCENALSYGPLGMNAHQADEWVDCESVITISSVLDELLSKVVFGE